MIDNKQTDDFRANAKPTFHIVGVGASAGGLEALEQFFKALPDETGAAFVVIQHLSPDFKSHMAELLERDTRMKVHRVENEMLVEPNAIYLIPPKMEMIVSNGKLLLTEKAKDGTISHPIDHFFNSLATERGPFGVAVILSGTGSDGSRGIRSVHEAGGLVFVQDEQSAKFDGMPMNAQSTGVVDVVLPPSSIAEAITSYIKNGLSPKDWVAQHMVANAADGVDRILQLLKQQHGLDFSCYKASTVGRRIQRRVNLLNFGSLQEYLDRIEADPAELNELYKDLLIGVTKFFRDPAAFSVLQQQVIPRIVANRDPETAIRVWVAGCASGEEAYSIAMLLDEELEEQGARNTEVKVFATDAHHGSLHAAATGIYSEEALIELAADRRGKYFRRRDNGYQVTPELRKRVVFAPHNLIRDAPFTQMDLVSCRNLLIYFQPDAQRKALSLFHFALKAGGTLFLGPSETPGELADEFDVVDQRWRIYNKRRDIRIPILAGMTAGSQPYTLRNSTTMSAAQPKRVDPTLLQTYDRILDRKMPPSILVNDNHQVLHIFGGAEKYLRLSGGRPTVNLLEMLGDSLKTAVSGALQHAVRKQQKVRYTGVTISGDHGREALTLTVDPIIDNRANTLNLLIEFQPPTYPDRDDHDVDSSVDLNEASKDRIASLESELRFTQENLQATVEEMETANEELQATNEELTASNEELQSTNEELHSVNEELYTVNAEHQRRVEELSVANSDMENLLETTRVGVIFLDSELIIRRYTPAVAQLFHLMPQDIGRPIQGFAHHLNHGQLVDDLRDVFSTERSKEVFTEDHAGAKYLLRMLPYRSSEGVSGVVMTLINVSELRTAEEQLERFRHVTEAAHDGIAILDEDANFQYVNPAMCRMLGYDQVELIQMTVTDVSTTVDRPHYRKLFVQAAEGGVKPMEMQLRRKDGILLPVEIGLSSVVYEGQQFCCANIRDLTDRIALSGRLEHLGEMVQQSRDAIITWELGGGIISWNKGAEDLYGFSAEEAVGKRTHELLQTEHPISWDEIYQALINQGEWKGELTHHTTSGETVTVSTLHQLLRMPSGRDQVLEINRDITEESRVQRQLQRANSRIRSILESVTDGFVFLDTHWRYRHMNEAAAKMLQKSHDEMIGKSIWRIFPGVEDTIFGEKFREAMETGEPTKFESFYEPLNAWYECRCYPSDKGLSVFFLDTTIGRDTQNQLERSQSEARRLAAVVENSKDFIGIATPNGRAVYVNAAGKAMVGLDPDSDVTQTKIMDYIAEESRALMLEEAIPAVKRDGSWKGRIRFRNFKDNSTIPTLWNAFVIKDNKSETPEVWVTISPDLTEQYAMEQALRDSERKAQDANRAKSEFLANMSHEIRTPMSAVLGYADVLLQHLKDADNRGCVQTIKRNGKHLLEIINDILDLSRIEAGKMEVDVERCSVAEVFADIESLMRPQAKEKSLELRIVSDGDVPATIETDRKRLKQILINLVGNAVKFTEEGHVEVCLRHVSKDDVPNLQIDVSDTGIGIKKDRISDLFEPFSRGDTSVRRKFGGTGLGLTISQRLARMLGGTLAVQSEPHSGSTFTLRIPIGPTAGTELTPLNLAAVVRDDQVFDADHRLDCDVLLVDDRRDVRHIAQHFLEEAGATIVTAQDGEEALRLVDRAAKSGEPFDIIVMDMQMPNLDGYTATSELRAMDFEAPIVALTADAMQGDREKCLAAGCDDYLAKPIDPPALVNAVARLTQQVTHAELRRARERRRLLPSELLAGDRDDVTSEDIPNDAPVRRVLIVDDEVDVAEMTAKLLAFDGHETACAYEAEVAIDLVADGKFHCVVLDIELPDANGLEVGKRLRESGFEGLLVALSGHDAEDAKYLAFEAGFDHYVVKPAPSGELDRIIRSHVSG